MSDAMLERLKAGLRTATTRSTPSTGCSTSPTSRRSPTLDRPELKDEPWVPVTRRPFAAPDAPSALRRDPRAATSLVHIPYESFATSVEAFVGQAARDPDVVAIKTTVYRTSDESALVPALIEAAEDGQAGGLPRRAEGALRRAAEHRVVARAGAGGRPRRLRLPDLKIHAKMTLVVRREGDGAAPLRAHRHRQLPRRRPRALYEDFGLFTADEDIAADVADLFNYLTGFGRPQRFRKLLVAPFKLRARLDRARSARVAARRRGGKKARIRIKVNSLDDPSDDRGAVRGVAGGRADRDRRARDLHAPPGGARA